MNLLGYGCEEKKEHQYYYKWLGALRAVHQELCPEMIALKDAQDVCTESFLI